MSAFRSAYINELVKLKAKKGIILIAVLMLVFTVGMSFSQSTDIPQGTKMPDYDKQIEALREDIEYYKQKAYYKTPADIKTASGQSVAIFSAYRQIEEIKNDIYYYELLRDMGVKHDNDYRKKLLDEVFNPQYDLLTLYENVIEENELAIWLRLNLPSISKGLILKSTDATPIREKADKYINAALNGDFEMYIDWQNDIVLDSHNFTDDEKRVALEINFLRKKGNITGQSESHKYAFDVLAELKAYKLSVLSGVDSIAIENSGTVDKLSTSVFLLPSEIERYEEIIAVEEHKIESGYYNILKADDANEPDAPISFAGLLIAGMTMLASLITVVLAASAFTSEVSSGSVKLLMVAPVKRWKVFAAKGAMLLTLLAVLAVYEMILAYVASGIVYGFGYITPYVYYGTGRSVLMPFAVYVAAHTLANFIPTLFYTVLAYMLSTLFKKTNASMGLSLGAYYFGTAAMIVVMIFLQGSYLKYIPFTSVSDIGTMLFPESFMSSFLGEFFGITEVSIENSVLFAGIYIALWCIVFVLIGRDAVCRRDIK